MANQFNLAEAYVELKTRDAGFNAGLGNAESRLDKLRLKMEAVSRTAQIMFVAGAAALAYFVKQASDAEEIASKFDAVFKEGAASAREWAAELGDAVGRSKIDIEQYMATLQDTFVPLGFARDKSADLSKELTKLGIDLASFKNEAEPETIDRLTSAIVGNHEAVRGYGVVITQATLKQELLNMGIEGGVKNATEMQKVQARLNLIMAGTTDAQGDALKTAGSMANQWKAMKGELRDVSIELGQAFMPLAKELVAWAREWLPGLAEWVKENKTLVADTAKLTAAVLAFLIVAPKLVKAVGAITGAYKAMAVAQTAATVSAAAGGTAAAAAGGTAAGAAAVTAGAATRRSTLGLPFAKRIAPTAIAAGGTAAAAGTSVAAGIGGAVLGAGAAAGAGLGIAAKVVLWDTASDAAEAYNQKLERQKELEDELAAKQRQRLQTLQDNLTRALALYEKETAVALAGLKSLADAARERKDKAAEAKKDPQDDLKRGELARVRMFQERDRLMRLNDGSAGSQARMEDLTAKIRAVEVEIGLAESELAAIARDKAKAAAAEFAARPQLSAPTGYGGGIGRFETSSTTVGITEVASTLAAIANQRAQEELARETNVHLVEVNSKLDKTNQLLANNQPGWK